MTAPLVSVGIPLYRSGPFVDTLRANLAALAQEPDIEIIVSDRHQFDDTLSVLRDEWRGDPRFRFVGAHDRLDWVQHLNGIVLAAGGEYFRWMPHDDVFPAGCLGPLVDRLASDPDTVLAYGPTRAIDENGARLPDRDMLHTDPVGPGGSWTFDHSLELFWRGWCDGAFKGLFRRSTVLGAGALVRPTHELVNAERAWLFGVSLLGGLGEEPDSTYLKRFHPGSTHAQWQSRTRHVVSTTATMCGYLNDLEPSRRRRVRGTRTLWSQALRRVAEPTPAPEAPGLVSLRTRSAASLLSPKVLVDVAPQLRDRVPRRRPRPSAPSTRRVVDELDGRGVAVLEGVASPALVAAGIRDLDAFVATIDALAGERRTKPRSTGGTVEYEVHEHQSELGIHRSHDPLAFSSAFAEFLARDEVRAVAEGYLGRDWCHQAMVATRTAPTDQAKRGFDQWHHDARGRKLNAILLLTDVAEDGPATVVVAGSHRLLYTRDRRVGNFFSDEEVSELLRAHGWSERVCAAPAGSVVFFDSHALHRGRRTSHRRDAFQVNFMNRRDHRWPHTIRDDIVASLDPTTRAMLFDRARLRTVAPM